ncbi:zinc finger HIT domain-containing protein 1 [Thecamonas trahens ATCC 50062]|uniref:Zinc finger HIT domain-containing protein 1 n=1 Tax=Thecamonas trahens ATCC 50062 TaxID=461836 RepID=A0A0L0DTL6_THETB|nr:zinc finger HIT domain-containing protein 1 [Thecamonas trahens ATCC 50062]KNC54813.1 zinc finger HIT domain-containing protein 1 [Thecamonas trahens ATCC 50062]|eukprot:XP_013761712.1 zinc finger HIT domain-containing protein 1 [Thecamonas trahens ATCC 50062]
MSFVPAAAGGYTAVGLGGRSGSKRKALRSGGRAAVVPLRSRARRVQARLAALEMNNAKVHTELETLPLDGGADMVSSVYGVAGKKGAAKDRAKHRAIVQAKRNYGKVFSRYVAELGGLPDVAASHKPNYLTVRARSSREPPRAFCDVCGLIGPYTCTVCGVRYCQLACLAIHSESRCTSYKR